MYQTGPIDPYQIKGLGLELAVQLMKRYENAHNLNVV